MSNGKKEKNSTTCTLYSEKFTNQINYILITKCMHFKVRVKFEHKAMKRTPGYMYNPVMI